MTTKQTLLLTITAVSAVIIAVTVVYSFIQQQQDREKAKEIVNALVPQPELQSQQFDKESLRQNIQDQIDAQTPKTSTEELALRYSTKDEATFCGEEYYRTNITSGFCAKIREQYGGALSD
jgi:uncharacterized protein HemX